ncbi:hypothetical protein J6590_068118 [Homalodisca vitripennis]|nr:hypothetical protein J6590_068118 [Homalodisca vitripennis]
MSEFLSTKKTRAVQVASLRRKGSGGEALRITRRNRSHLTRREDCAAEVSRCSWTMARDGTDRKMLSHYETAGGYQGPGRAAAKG